MRTTIMQASTRGRAPGVEPALAFADRRPCEHVFAMPPPYRVVRVRLDRAIAGGDLAEIRSAARDRPGVVTLVDAVQVLMLMRTAGDPAFDAAAVRWIARFTGECAGVTLGEAHAAVEALGALPAPDARATLSTLLKRRGPG
jgi:hypothetical protein